ncbi:hypothetical protein OPIT5_14365 [Opitutaceae bacterium TAV5]|nr:hypothetical protein OPIT5_14365 [Opitutaceae bacterium TAV5]
MHTSRRQGIINIVNFIRGIEPRPGRNIDLVEPVVRQRALARQHRLPVTWLIQYDAMLDRRFLDILEDIGPEDEIGVWFEFVQPLVEKAGLPWRGRYPWDWHVNVGFSVGYAPDERLRMIDIFLEDFRATFGFSPRAAGSWFIDAHSLAHLEKRHGIAAFCNCKDQWGTDGYTLWGGYINQAYYPSRQNSFIPAQTIGQQINIPVFRMLGSDPIRQYELPRGTGSCGGQAVITLEPISPEGGRNPEWTDRFFKNMFETPCLSFGYAQAGQENSFGWPAMEQGLVYQHRRIAELRDAGLIRVETLSRSGEWFRSAYASTPPSAVVAERDVDAADRGATWYCSKYYRSGLIWEGGELRIRDIQLFDERREEAFLKTACATSACKYDALPLLDGFLWSGDGHKAGLRLVHADGTRHDLQSPPQVTERDPQTLRVQVDDHFAFTFGETFIELRGTAAPRSSPAGWMLAADWSPTAPCAFRGVDGNRLRFSHEGYDYTVMLLSGNARSIPHGFVLQPDADGLVRIGMAG